MLTKLRHWISGGHRFQTVDYRVLQAREESRNLPIYERETDPERRAEGKIVRQVGTKTQWVVVETLRRLGECSCGHRDQFGGEFTRVRPLRKGDK